ncbi:TPA_asm: nucleoprotein [Psilorhabdovirus 2]|nr:TPA_asm: nucleoprotein [Psilorhabdovirus 2]
MTDSICESAFADLGTHAIYDPRIKKFVGVESKVPMSVVNAQYYPETNPISRIPFEYPANQAWTIEAAAAKIHACLRSDTVPPLDIQIYFLVEYHLSKKYKAIEDVKVGAYLVKKGVEFNGGLFIEFIKKDTQTPLESLTTVPADMYEGLAAWLLIQARIGRNLTDPARTEYFAKILEGLKRISVAPPFNIPPGDLVHFPSSPSIFSLTCSSPQILFLASVYDYCALASDNQADMTLRYATLTTRYHDHLALTLLNALTVTKLIPTDKIISTFITEGLARDGLQILKPGQGVGSKYSLTPYSRAMGLVPKSCYSLTENPHFSAFASVLVACTGTPNQTLITHTGVSVDLEITIAIKLCKYILSAAPVGRFAVDGTGRNPTEEELQELSIDASRSIDEVIERVIREVKAQEGKPTEMELNELKKKLEKVQTRQGTLCQYIRTMSYYTPSEIDLDLGEGSDTLSVYQ